jgi:hypothetical protein
MEAADALEHRQDPLFSFLMFVMTLTETGGKQGRRSSPFLPEDNRVVVEKSLSLAFGEPA